MVRMKAASGNSSASGRKPEPKLSPRQQEILLLLCEGHSNKQIAEALKLSTRTIEAYRANLMRKLRLRSFPELVRYAVRSSVIQPNQLERPMPKAEGRTGANASRPNDASGEWRSGVDLSQEFDDLQSSFKSIQRRFKQAKTSKEKGKLLAALQEILLRADAILAQHRAKARSIRHAATKAFRQK